MLFQKLVSRMCLHGLMFPANVNNLSTSCWQLATGKVVEANKLVTIIPTTCYCPEIQQSNSLAATWEKNNIVTLVDKLIVARLLWTHLVDKLWDFCTLMTKILFNCFLKLVKGIINVSLLNIIHWVSNPFFQESSHCDPGFTRRSRPKKSPSPPLPQEHPRVGGERGWLMVDFGRYFLHWSLLI